MYGFTKASTDGWGAPVTVGFIAGALVLLAAFVVVELRSANPLLPMRILTERTRGGAYLASTLAGAGFIGAMLFLTYYLQVVLRYQPLTAGLASLPLTAGLLLTAGIATALLPRVGGTVLMATGSVIAGVGMVLLARIGVGTAYASHVLPAELVLGAGLGLFFVPLGNVGLVGVGEHDAGAASAVINASQQVGGSLGTALLNTVATTATTAYLGSHVPGPLTRVQGLVHGYVVAFWWVAGIFLFGAVVCGSLMRRGPLRPVAPGTPAASAAPASPVTTPE